MKKFLAAAAVTSVAVLTACGSSNGDSGNSVSTTSSTAIADLTPSGEASASDASASNGSGSDAPTSDGEHNATDVMFAQMMIPHHQQAIEMADMVPGKQVSEELSALAQQIKDAQQPEIDQMTGWLEDWDEPMPDMPMDQGAHAGHGGMGGMMSEEDMAALEAADGEEFETMWLEMMIEHHAGAIEMAEMVKSGGQFPEALEMADAIIESQQAEIDQMEDMLGQ